MILQVSGDEVAALKAAIVTGLDELERTGGGSSSDAHDRLTRLQGDMAAQSDATARLKLDADDALLLRAYVTTVMALRGYVVGRPGAINALVALHSKLDRLLTGS
jgi:hypothetical protein